MKRVFYGILAIALLSFHACTRDDEPLPAPGQPDTPGEVESRPGQLFVKFSPEVSDLLDGLLPATRSGGPATRSGIASVDEVMRLVGDFEIERVFPVDKRYEERTREAELHLWYIVRFGEEFATDEVAARLRGLGEVQHVNLNRTIKRAYNRKPMPLTREALARMRASTRSARAGYPYNDELLPAQWHLINRGDMFLKEEPKSIEGADVQVEQAWKRSTGDPSIIVAVLDEGIFVDHPDLQYNIWRNEDEVRGSNRDNDNNGYTGDYNGYNFVHNTGVITWDDVKDTGHATHVAGVIAARNDNGIGIGSIAGGTAEQPGVKVMSCQIFSGGTQGDLLAEVKAIKYATDNGAVILQCSWGYTSGAANPLEWGPPGYPDEETWATENQIEKAAFDYFLHNAGSPNGPIDGGLAIFAGGNESAALAGFPGAAEDFISVAATAADYTPAVYTNYGPGTKISAPGGDQDYYFEYYDDTHKRGEIGCVLSALPYNVSETGYGYMEGTSMACPHVSGVAALGLSYAAQLRKHFKAEEFRELIYANTTPIDAYMTGTKEYYRYVADVGLNTRMKLNLSTFNGKMGVGQVNAAKLLAAIDENGTPLTFPNLYVPLEGEVTAIPANYFVGGEQLTYTCSVEDETVASASIDQRQRMIVKGLRTGITRATVTAGNGTVHTFHISVRKAAGDNGWL